MTILVFGKTGQVATELSFLPDMLCLRRKDVDRADPVACSNAIATYRPSAVINAAAYAWLDTGPHASLLDAKSRAHR